MKKTKADFIAKKYPTWIDVLDKIPNKNKYVEWLLEDGSFFLTAISSTYKGFLKNDGIYGPRYWRSYKAKRHIKELREIWNEK